MAFNQALREEDLLLTRDQVAQMLGWTRPRTVTELVNKGEFPKPIRVAPQTFRWQKKVLRAWLDARDESVNSDGTIIIPKRRGRRRAEA